MTKTLINPSQPALKSGIWRQNTKHMNRSKKYFLEKKIMKCVNQEIKPHWGSLWGQKHWCEPAYCGIAEGDGKQVVWLKTIDSRPNYYIIRIDSKTDVDGNNFDFEILYTCVEEIFGNVDSYKEVVVDGGRKYKYYDDEDLINDDEVGFPNAIYRQWGILGSG